MLLSIPVRTVCESKGARRSDRRCSETLRLSVITEDLRLPFDEGAKKTAVSLIRSFRRKGVEVSVFARCGNPLMRDALQLPGNKLLLGYQFGRNLRGQSSDAILYIPTSSGTVGAFVRAAVLKALSLGTPVALLHLQYRELPPHARYLGLQRLVSLVFTQSISSTKALRSFGCKAFLLPGGVDPVIFTPISPEDKSRLRTQYGFQESERIILHVGHLNSQRNVAVCTRLVESGYRVVLIASTSTPVDAQLLSTLQRARVTVITHFVQDIQHFYQIADCYLFPVFQSVSAIDAPLSVLEAMACNLPVVTTPFGALPTMFQPGHGLYFWRSEEDLLAKVTQAMGDRDCRTSEMIASHTWDQVASTVLDMLQQISHI